MKELLAPAGDFDTLRQAIHNGSDAIYLGGKRFGARKFAANFDDEEMIKAIKYCHLYGVKIYVTVNTLIFDNEVDECLEYITFLHKNGVDAVIMQDIGMISLVRKVLPNLDIHASTQMNTHNINQIKLLEELGVTRVVLARELSIEEIEKLDTKLEIEAFIHGALCVCYSGQCLFSSLLLNRSGNRGECAGICRLPFSLLEDGNEVKTEGNYLLSPKELNTTNNIKRLLESNITSFKIEGRKKSATTIGYITRLYRMLIDHYEKGEEIELTPIEQEQLLVLFNRGFTAGYLFNKSGRDIMNISSPNHIGIEIGEVIEVTSKRIKIKLEKQLNQGDGIRFPKEQLGMNANYIYDKHDNLISHADTSDIIEVDNKIGLTEVGRVLKTVDSKLLKSLGEYPLKKIPISLHVSAHFGKKIEIIANDGTNQVVVDDNIIEKATGNGTSRERILEQLSKLGDTPFIIKDYDLDVEEGLFIPISKLNDLRRRITDSMISIRENTKKEVIINDKYYLDKKTSDNIEIAVLVRNEDQLKACLEEKVNYIYVADYNLYEKYSSIDNVYLRLDRVINNHREIVDKKLLVGEVGSIYKYSTNNIIDTDYFLNVGNSYTVDYLRQKSIKNITLSIENSLDSISSIISNVGNSGLAVLVYGRIEAMITKYCPLKMLVNDDKVPCNICHSGKKYMLKDRNGESYPLVQDKELTHIFYYRNLELSDKLTDLLRIGVRKYRFEFFDEDNQTVKLILKKYKTFLL